MSDHIDEAGWIVHVLTLELTEETRAKWQAAAERIDYERLEAWARDTLDASADPDAGQVVPVTPTGSVGEWEAVVRARRGISALAAFLPEHEPWADMKGRVEALIGELADQEVRYRDMHGLMTTAFERRQATAQSAEQILTLAEHLFGMVDQEAWRDTGGDDGQGHYEGDYRAEGVEAQLVELRKLFPRPEPGEAT